MSSVNALEEICECCDVISDSIQAIIRRSLNEKFRERCFELLEVNNSFEAGQKVRTKLTEIIDLSSDAKSNKKSRKRIRSELQSNYYEKAVGYEGQKYLNLARTAGSENVNSKLPDQLLHNWASDEINVDDIDDWK